MVRAILHIICGNCGSNDDFEYRISHEPDYKEAQTQAYEREIDIYCNSCSTIHSLEDNAKQIIL